MSPWIPRLRRAWPGRRHQAACFTARSGATRGIGVLPAPATAP
jgi:hypothetical protein